MFYARNTEKVPTKYQQVSEQKLQVWTQSDIAMKLG